MSVPLVGCPICGKSPIDINCVRDWLKVSGHPLHSEWQERMAQYANEVSSSAFQRGQQAMAEKAAQHVPAIHLDESGNVPHAWITCDCGWDGRGKLPWDDQSWKNHIRRSLASAEPPQGEVEKEGRG